jgi:high-affinity iron transporter
VSGKKVPLRVFFRVTGFFLLLVAAGLLAYGIHEIQELGYLPLKQTAWNINSFLNEKQGLGAFLKSLFGYNGNPSILEVLIYSIYLLAVGLFLKLRPVSSQSAST